MSGSCGYECEDRNVNVLWGGAKLAGASSVIGVMLVGGGADSVRAGDAVLFGLDVEDNRVALCDL